MTGQLVRSVSSRLARNPVSKHKMEVVEEDIHITSAPPHVHINTHIHHIHTQNVKIEKGVGCVQGASFYLESTWDGMCPGLGLCKEWRTVPGGHSGKGTAEGEVEFAPAWFQRRMILGPHLCSQVHCGKAGMGRHA